STTTTVAPTGTISIIADCSSGIEPLFALAYKHQGLEGTLSEYVHPIFLDAMKNEGLYTQELVDKIKQAGSIKDIPEVPQHFRSKYVTAMEIAPIWHLKVQAAFQRYTDNAVSKTINLPNNASIEDVKNIYMAAYDLGCRGITIYRDMSRETQVLVKGPQSRYVHVRERPEKLEGVTYKINTGSGVLFVTINKDEEGNPLEVFATLGKAGGSDYATTEGLGRSISLMLRAGVDPKEIVKQYRGISCDRPYGFGEERILSIPDAIGKALEKFLIDKGVLESALTNMDFGSESQKNVGTCPECGAPLLYEEGCRKCSVNCGYNECS
ncbi:MAG: ribonucleotide-diphosphate reductase subunit alpha, partial [Candidatus Bathyarchaeia archaeon]